MGFKVLDRLNKAGQATEAYLKRKWETRHLSAEEAAARAEAARRIEERNQFLQLVAGKLTGDSACEMPAPLRCDPGATHKAVFLVTVPIAFGRFELSRSTYRLLARYIGMSLDGVSHWALCVVDRTPLGPTYCYDLMSDQIALNALGRNQFRVAEVTPDAIHAWSSCYYVGETTKSHEVIQQLGENFMTINPHYNLLSNNCQTMAESLVKLLCDGKLINKKMLNEELSAASPKMAMDLMVSRLRSKVEVQDASEDRPDVKEDVDTIRLAGFGTVFSGPLPTLSVSPRFRDRPIANIYNIVKAAPPRVSRAAPRNSRISSP
ncbi:hypothetical protein DL762_007494 [Monosporascus cannonballus]|uniref:PPPDE domain-containing protein n=1 Tax=Monosporascus cannonballus TaxID=155416 RepID=A0ABY0H2N1_9PEZI|nr:hypothetical protein DL762_007494 [Monosporascus cannonballus]RYO82743.1 hypothetical protein DL763_008132 [Monosporascus cannonballus]